MKVCTGAFVLMGIDEKTDEIKKIMMCMIKEEQCPRRNGVDVICTLEESDFPIPSYVKPFSITEVSEGE